MRVILSIILILSGLSFFGQKIEVNDTDFSKGKLGNLQTVTLDDVAKLHGHLCDGLVEGFLALQWALEELFPNQAVDRTALFIISKPSPCLSDVALYLSGARYQYGNYYVSNDFEGLFIIHHPEGNRTLQVMRKPQVKPAIIDELGSKAIALQLNACELDSLKKLEDEYTAYLLSSEASDLFELIEVYDFQWNPILKNDFLKTDVLNKNQFPCNNKINK